MKTIANFLEEINTLERRKAVYVDIVEYISQFITTDCRKPTKGIQSPVGNEDVIPEECIEFIKLEFDKMIKDIGEQIKTLKDKSVSGSVVKDIGKKKKSKSKISTRRRSNVNRKSRA